MRQFTKKPWEITASNKNGKNVELDEMTFFCDQTGNAKANAKHIVKCVNMHDKLVEAVIYARQTLRVLYNHTDDREVVLKKEYLKSANKLDELLKQAKGE